MSQKPYYQDEWATIWNCDCREILPTLPKVDLVLTDPPYESLNVMVGTGTTTRLVGPDQCNGKRLVSSNGKRWFSTLSAEQLGGIWPLLRSCIKPTGALYVFADVKSGLEIFPSLVPANIIIWDKQALGMGYSWRRCYEMVAYCPLEGHKLRSMALGDIIRAPGVENKLHPTEKPVNALIPIIANSTDVGGLVLDPFLGSGSTLCAAKDTGRRAIGIDTEERYCEIAAKRLAQLVFTFSDSKPNSLTERLVEQPLFTSTNEVTI